ncbi:MAG TPA: DivIVA domain-containing protein [Micromonosporaceae bacterium]
MNRARTAALRIAGRLTPALIRNHRFRTRWRGLDPDEVYEFMNALADEIALMSRELLIANQENDRIKKALKDWQTRHTPAPGHEIVIPANRRPCVTWPVNSG